MGFRLRFSQQNQSNEVSNDDDIYYCSWFVVDDESIET